MQKPVYLVTVADSTDADKMLAYAFGSFRTVSTATKDALAEIKDAAGEYTVRIAEVEAIGDNTEKRVVASVSGDADVVTFVTKKKLAAERKANGGKDETEAGDTAE